MKKLDNNYGWILLGLIVLSLILTNVRKNHLTSNGMTREQAELQMQLEDEVDFDRGR